MAKTESSMEEIRVGDIVMCVGCPKRNTKRIQNVIRKQFEPNMTGKNNRCKKWIEAYEENLLCQDN